MEVFPNDDKPSFIDVRDLNFSAEEIHASLYSASYSHLAGLASGTPDSVKDVVEGDDVVLQCRFSPALADSSATLYWIRCTPSSPLILCENLTEFDILSKTHQYISVSVEALIFLFSGTSTTNMTTSQSGRPPSPPDTRE